LEPNLRRNDPTKVARLREKPEYLFPRQREELPRFQQLPLRRAGKLETSFEIMAGGRPFCMRRYNRNRRFSGDTPRFRRKSVR
jgi:hypothetical protein